MIKTREQSLDSVNQEIEAFKRNNNVTQGTIGMHLKKYILENNENFVLINDGLFLGGNGDYSLVDNFILARMNTFSMSERELDSLRFGIYYNNFHDVNHKINYGDKREGFFESIKYKEDIIFPFFTRKLKSSETGGHESSMRIAISHNDFFENMDKIGLLKREYFTKQNEDFVKDSFSDGKEFYKFFSKKGVSDFVLNSVLETFTKNSPEDLEEKVKFYF
ncbi:hypothetical protein GW932_01675 [archaeon]|nr:hypothetical protein [archaeon]